MMWLVPNRRTWFALAFGFFGIAAIVWIVVEIGAGRVAGALARFAPWAPFVFALEGARIGAEVWSTRTLYGRAGRSVPIGRLVRAVLMAYPVTLLAPAGRIGGESLKALLLADAVGAPRAAAAAVQLQALPLLAQFAVSVPCLAVAAWVWGASAFTLAILVQMLTALGLATFVLVAARTTHLGRVVGRVSERFQTATHRVQEELGRMGTFSRGAFAAQLVGRCLLSLEVVLLARAVEVPRGLAGALLTLGVHFVGQAAGDLLPAQLGTIDGAWAMAAEPLGAPSASLVAAALVFHATQLSWAGIGVMAAFWRAQRAATA